MRHPSFFSTAFRNSGLAGVLVMKSRRGYLPALMSNRMSAPGKAGDLRQSKPAQVSARLPISGSVELAHRQNGLSFTRPHVRRWRWPGPYRSRVLAPGQQSGHEGAFLSGRGGCCPRRLAMAVILSSCTAMSLRWPTILHTSSARTSRVARRLFAGNSSAKNSEA